MATYLVYKFGRSWPWKYLTVPSQHSRVILLVNEYSLSDWLTAKEGGIREPKQRTFLRSGTSGRFKQWMVFGITRVTGVLSVFTFAVWNVLTYSISNFRKIFVAERDSCIFFAPFSYEHFIFHNFIRQAWNAIVYSVFDCQSRHKSSEQKLPYMIAVNFNCSFINHQWDLVCSSLSK